MSIPNLQFIRFPEDLENASAPNLKNRAAEYIEDNAIYINCMYDVIDEATDQLLIDYYDKDENTFEKIKDEAKNICSKEMAWLVTKGVVYAIAKKRKIGFNQEDIEKALDPTSLTTHADNLIHNIDICSKQLKEKAKMIEENLM